MADVSKNVEIALKIVGANDTTLKNLVGAFEKIQTAVNNTTKSIDKFKTAIDSIKVPDGMTAITKAFQQLNGIKFSNLEQIATGFEKLKIIGKPVDLQPFAEQLKKLALVGTLPNLSQIGTGLEKIINTPLSSFAVKVGTLQKQLTRLQGIGTLPNLKQIASGVELLIKTPLSGLATKIGSLEKQLTRLSGIGNLPNLGQIGTGLATIIKTPLSGFGAKVTSIETGLKRLASIDLTNLATVLSNLTKINLSKVSDQLARTERAIKQTGDTAQTAGLKIGTFAGKVKTVLQFRIIAEGFAHLRNAIMGGIDAIIDYDQALKDLQAITNATTLEVAQMGDKIIEVAKSTKFSAAEVAAGMRTIGQAGFSASEAVQTMQAVSDLATGTLSTMGTTVDLVTTAMRVFRIDAADSAEVADVFANAVNRSKLTVDKLRTAMNFVGPIARDSGITFKELAASMGTLANSGLRASTIGTGLRRIFAELVDPSKKLRDAVRGSGVAMEELDPRTNALSTVLSNLRIVVNDASLAFDIFGKRGASAVLSLTSASSGFESMLTTLSEQGTAARQAAKQMEGLGVAFKNMRDRAGALAISIGEAGVTKAMKVFVDVVRGLITVLTFFTDSVVGKVVVGFTVITTAIMGTVFALNALKATAVFQGIVTGIQAVTSAVLFLETSVLSLLGAFAISPIGIAIIAVTAAVSGLVWWLGKARKEAEASTKLADEYSQLTEQINNYSVKVAGLTENTKEHTDANKVLRRQLLEVAESYSDVSTEALAAALAIDPMTGKITEGSEALELYNKRLEEVAYKKLIKANEAVNKSFAKLVVPGEILEDLGQGANDTGTHFDNVAKHVAFLEGEVRSLTSVEKELIDEFKALEAQSLKNITKMERLGKVNLNNSINTFKRLAEEQGASGDVLDAMISQFAQLKSTKAPDNLIEKWAEDGSYAIADLFEEYENISGKFGDGKGIFGVDAAGVSEKELIIKSVAAKKALKIELDALNERTAASLAAGEDEVLIARKHQTELRDLEEKANALKRSDAELEVYQKIKTLQRLKEENKKFNAENAQDNKDNALERVRIADKANTEYLNNLERLRSAEPYSAEDQEEKHKEYLDTLALNHEKHLHEIALLEAKGVINTDQANADKKTSTLKYYQDVADEAERYLKIIGDTDGTGTDRYKDQLAIQKKANARSIKEQKNALVDGTKLANKAKEELNKLDKDYIAETEKNTKKVGEIRSKAAKDYEKIDLAYDKKRRKIDDDYAKAKIALQKSLVDNAKTETQDIFDINQSAEDALLKLRQKGMSDEAKAASDQANVLKKFAEGRNLLNKYYLWGDEADLANGKALLTQSLGMVDTLDDVSKATKLVGDARYNLKKIAGFEKDIADAKALAKLEEEQAKRDKKLAEAKEDYDNKVKNATKAIQDIQKEEYKRHNAEMTNQLKELGVYKLKLEEARKLVELAGGTVDRTGTSSLDSDSTSVKKSLEEELGLLGKIKEVKKETVLMESSVKGDDGIVTYTSKVLDASTGVKELKEESGKTLDAMAEDIDGAFSGVWENIGEDGVRTFTDIKSSIDDASDSTDTVQTALNDANSALEDTEKLSPYQKTLDQVTQLTTQLESLSLLDTVYDIVANVIGYDDVVDLLDAIDDLKDKTVTITTKYSTVGSQAVAGLAGGGRLPGFGGGDRNPALLEDGEWVINKFAVRKFGDDFMSSINNMTMPRFATGGKVGIPSSAPTKSSSPFGNLGDFGTVSLDTGSAKIPAIMQQNVFGQLTTHLNNLKRFST